MAHSIEPAGFWDKVRRGDASECWEWTASRTVAGYGQVHVGRNPASGNSVMRYAHRIAYEAAKGAIGASMVLDHLCRNRACCNPDHLEPVTRRENVRRGIKGVLTTACPRGHAYTPENSYFEPATGHRKCRECNRLRSRSVAKHRAAHAAVDQ